MCDGHFCLSIMDNEQVVIACNCDNLWIKDSLQHLD